MIASKTIVGLGGVVIAQSHRQYRGLENGNLNAR